ncbi:MAG TPA: CHAT domain-containing protein [Pyrinomonadaceae bacterium]|nr:CHAT domain-containing protein [Pyrinomonadaceae bacterium]HMP67015.1 CHAT domain-containing protein [Pyrinomonadaceae bacterium]
MTGLLLFSLSVTDVWAQIKGKPIAGTKAQLSLWNGDSVSAIDQAQIDIVGYKKAGDVRRVGLSYETKARALIALARYAEVDATLTEAIEYLTVNGAAPRDLAFAHLAIAEVRRSERKTSRAFEQLNKALQFDPSDRLLRAEYNLGIGKVLFKSGYDGSAIIWLEKAGQLFDGLPVSEGKLDTYRFLALAWSAKLNYPKSLEYSQAFVTKSEGTPFRARFRQALFEHGSTLNAAGQKRRAFAAFEYGLTASLNSGSSFQARKFLAVLLLNALYDHNIERAEEYHRRLTDLDSDGEYLFERLLGKAVIHGFRGDKQASTAIFNELKQMEKTSEFLIPSWKILIAENDKDWNTVLDLNSHLLDLTLKGNFRDDLPRIYLSLANANFQTNRKTAALEFTRKSVGLIEEIRVSEDQSLSLGLLETYHKAYRLLTQFHLDKPQQALESSDYLKARILKDRIDNAQTRTRPEISPELRQRLTTLSTEFIRNPGVAGDLDRLERSITTALPPFDLTKTELSKMDEIRGLEDAAVISYFIGSDKKLVAFVWEKGRSVRSIELQVDEDEIAADIESAHRKIRNRVFFKRDGKALFDKLLKPLLVSAKHLVIVPDKHLWKVPFQALSPDGEKYLIEDKIVSYAPSVSILFEQLKSPKPVRRTMHAFANASFNNQFLKYVNAEATSIAGFFGSSPVFNATVGDFRRLSDKADILHFSMHAQVDNDQPLDSFLGFKGAGKESGRLTVEDLLNIKLKKGSLVFLASCDTNNVLSGEGLVSLAWGMMGAGATTVISAQWEANDKLTEVFTKAFYKYYNQGYSSAEALQNASLEMIKNKSSNMNEPYFWADFTLNGDFR